MPPESAQERTEAPTPRRRSEARQRGQIGKSSDLTAALVLLGAMLVLEITGRKVLERLLGIMRQCLDEAGQSMIDTDQIAPMIARTFGEMAILLTPYLIVVVILALVGSFAQVGVLLTFKPLVPSLGKLNPINGFKRMFSLQSVVTLLMGIAKMSLVTLVAYVTIRNRVETVAYVSVLSYLSVIAVSAELIMTLALRLAITLLILGIIDFIWQRYKRERDLRMTKEEIKEELKRMDGDPEVKRRRREVQMQQAIQRIKSSVPQADVVVTNPTELAIAIAYDADTMLAPKVVAKGAGYLARRIREVAIEHRIPIVERKPLARALYKTVEVGQEVPPEFYKAIAEILAYVYELAGGRFRKRSPAEAMAALN